MNKLKIGVVGLGNIGTASLNHYKANPSVEIVAVCDLREERVKEVCDTLNIAAGFTDIRELLVQCPEIDMVSIHNIDSAHAGSALDVLEAGKHVFVEKPLGLNIEDCHRIAELAKEKGKKVAVGQVVRFRKYVKSVKELVSLGTLGTIYNIEIEYMTDQMKVYPHLAEAAKIAAGF